MRRAALTVSSLSVLVVLALPGATLAVGTLDQEQSHPGDGAVPLYACYAQTFTAGISGKLDRVSLYLVDSGSTDTDLAVDIRDTSSGVPATILATEIVDRDVIPDGDYGWVDIDFSTPPRVSAGTVYAITAHETSAQNLDSRFFWNTHQVQPDGPYTGGKALKPSTLSSPCTSLDEWAGGSVDMTFKTYVTEADPQPDGRIRLDRGDWVGGNIYNTTGVGQSRSGDARPGDWRMFRIQVQNDGNMRDKFTIDADGAAVNGYRVEFMRGTTDITSAVVNGTFRTRWLRPGQRLTIDAWVKVKSRAAKGSSISRVVTLSSITDPTAVDAVRFTISRR